VATGTVTALKGVRELPRSTPRTQRSTMDTVLLTPAAVDAWHKPPFQRPLKINAKLAALAEMLKNDGGVIPGVITIGVYEGKKYLIDGQHRVEAFRVSELPEGLADIRICHFDSMGDMGDAFVELNSSLVKLKPDDILRALEGSHPALALLRKRCPFIGYDNIRRGPNSPIIGMSQTLRSWQASMPEVPNRTTVSASELGLALTEDDAKTLARFLGVAFAAWGPDREYQRLWGGLNIVLTMWLYRRIVISRYSPKTVVITDAQFQRCLMAMSANSKFTDWLVGRTQSDRDRSPCYLRIRAIFAARIEADTGKKYYTPSPEWSASSGRLGAVFG